MNTDQYILNKLENLSEVDKILSKRVVDSLGEWSSVGEVAKYLKKHKNTIYDKIYANEVISRNIGGRKLIYSPSIILLLQENNNY